MTRLFDSLGVLSYLDELTSRRALETVSMVAGLKGVIVNAAFNVYLLKSTRNTRLSDETSIVYSPNHTVYI